MQISLKEKFSRYNTFFKAQKIIETGVWRISRMRPGLSAFRKIQTLKVLPPYFVSSS